MGTVVAASVAGAAVGAEVAGAVGRTAVVGACVSAVAVGVAWVLQEDRSIAKIKPSTNSADHFDLFIIFSPSLNRWLITQVIISRNVFFKLATSLIS